MSDGEPPIDEHLRAALRHAPDHELEPPARLSERILGAAKASVAWEEVHAEPVRERASPPWWAGLGSRLVRALSGPRPLWGGALAALVLGGVTLRMWWEQEPPPPVLSRDEAPRVAPAPLPAPTARQTPPSAPATAAAPATPVASVPLPGSAPPAESKSAPAVTAVPARPPRTEPATRARTVDVAPPVAAPAPAPARAAASPPAAGPVAMPAPAPVTAPVTSARPAAAQAPAAAIGEATTAAGAIPAEAHRAAAPMAKTRAAPAAVTSVADDLPAPSTGSPLRALLQPALAAYAAGQWTWQAPGMAERAPMDARGLERLARIERASLGLWLPDASAAEAPAQRAHPAIRWWQGGRPQGTLLLEPDRLLFIDPAGRRWVAVMPPAMITPLLQP